jgi:hypothetical protein
MTDLERHAGVLAAVLDRRDPVRGAVRVVLLDAAGQALAEVLRGLGFLATEVLHAGDDPAVTLPMACEPESVDVLVAAELPAAMVADLAQVLRAGGLACIHGSAWTREAIHAAGLRVDRHEERAGGHVWYLRKG